MGNFIPGGFVATSQQFVASQTDVFAIDSSGHLNVFWTPAVLGEGSWKGPEPIDVVIAEQPGVGVAGGPLAASRQFGADQTDVFFIDLDGRLTVFWVANMGAWQGPVRIGGALLAPPGSHVAVSQQFGLNQTDVFFIGTNGQLTLCWVDASGTWQGPVGVGPVGFAPPGCPLAASQQFGLTQTNVYVVDNTGTLKVYWVDGAGAWQGPSAISAAGTALPGSCVAASQQFGLVQTDVFLVDVNGQLNVFWVAAGGPWHGPLKLFAPGIYAPGCPVAASQYAGFEQTNVYVTDKRPFVQMSWVSGGGTWNVPQPLGGYGLTTPSACLAASQQIGVNQTDVFLVDKTGDPVVISSNNNINVWSSAISIGAGSS